MFPSPAPFSGRGVSSHQHSLASRVLSTGNSHVSNCSRPATCPLRQCATRSHAQKGHSRDLQQRRHLSFNSNTGRGSTGGLNAPATAAAAAAVATEGATAHVAPTGHADRVLGSLLGSMCGNALGIQVEPEKHFRLTKLFPHGLQSFWGFDYNTAKTHVPSGSTTGDFLTMLAVAQSLVENKQLHFFALLDNLADAYALYPADVRRYGPYSCMVLEALVQGVDPFSIAEKAEAMLDISTTRTGQAASTREERQRYGATDASAVLRAVPVALAYSGASTDTLLEAVDTAVLFSHPLSEGRDGAVLLGAAVAWLARSDPSAPECTPQALLHHLQQLPSLAPTTHSLLSTISSGVSQLPPLGRVSSWRQFWASKEWYQLVGVYSRLSKQNFAVQGNQAAAVALWVLMSSWQEPQQAVMLAATLGGNSGTTAAATGALAGALHGAGWLPQQWLQDLENKPGAAAAAAGANAEKGRVVSKEAGDEEGEEKEAGDEEGEEKKAGDEEGEEKEAGDEEGEEKEGSDTEAAFSLAACGVGGDAVAALAEQLATLHCQGVASLMQGFSQEA